MLILLEYMLNEAKYIKFLPKEFLGKIKTLDNIKRGR